MIEAAFCRSHRSHLCQRSDRPRDVEIVMNLWCCVFSDAIVSQVLDELGLQIGDELSGEKMMLKGRFTERLCRFMKLSHPVMIQPTFHDRSLPPNRTSLPGGWSGTLDGVCSSVYRIKFHHWIWSVCASVLLVGRAVQQIKKNDCPCRVSAFPCACCTSYVERYDSWWVWGQFSERISVEKCH